MKELNVEHIPVSEIAAAYDTIAEIMDKNELNFNTAWEHVRSALARTIVENAIEIK